MVEAGCEFDSASVPLKTDEWTVHIEPSGQEGHLRMEEEEKFYRMSFIRTKLVIVFMMTGLTCGTVQVAQSYAGPPPHAAHRWEQLNPTRKVFERLAQEAAINNEPQGPGIGVQDQQDPLRDGERGLHRISFV